MMDRRYLIVTADDFGASANINEGTCRAVENGVVNTISAMTNFPGSIGKLEALHEKHPHIGIGVHLNITTGRPLCGYARVPSLSGSTGDFHSVSQLLPKIRGICLDDLKRELTAQVEALLGGGIPVDHLTNQHGVLSLYPVFFDVVVDLAREYDLPVRSPVAASLKYSHVFRGAATRRRGLKIAAGFFLRHPIMALNLLPCAGLRSMEGLSQKLDAGPIPHPDLLIDCFWGRPTLSNMLHILNNLPPGVSELVIHAGTGLRDEHYPAGLDVGYFQNRQLELAVVESDAVKTLIEELGITLVGYGDLTRLTRS